MRLIDGKGKFLGKINIIDLLVLLAVIFVAVILGMKFVGGGDGLGSGTKLTYTVKVYDVKPEVYESLQSATFPDQLMADGVLLNGKVLSFEGQKTQRQVLQVTAVDGATSEVVPSDKDTYDLVFQVECTVGNAVKRQLGTQEIRLGKKHILKTANIEFEEGIITALKAQTPSK